MVLYIIIALIILFLLVVFIKSIRSKPADDSITQTRVHSDGHRLNYLEQQELKKAELLDTPLLKEVLAILIEYKNKYTFCKIKIETDQVTFSVFTDNVSENTQNFYINFRSLHFDPLPDEMLKKWSDSLI